MFNKQVTQVGHGELIVHCDRNYGEKYFSEELLQIYIVIEIMVRNSILKNFLTARKSGNIILTY